MPAPPKPKLGNAALLFADHEQNQSGFSRLKRHAQKPMLGHVLTFVFLFVVAGTVIAGQMPSSIAPADADETQAANLHSNIAVIRTSSENDQLVGTLIHSKDPELPNFSVANPDKPIQLAPQERERLLQIISN